MQLLFNMAIRGNHKLAMACRLKAQEAVHMLSDIDTEAESVSEYTESDSGDDSEIGDDASLSGSDSASDSEAGSSGSDEVSEESNSSVSDMDTDSSEQRGSGRGRYRGEGEGVHIEEEGEAGVHTEQGSRRALCNPGPVYVWMRTYSK